MERVRIGELSRRAEVTVRTVRHYESLGLLPRGAREGAGQHRYPEQALARLRKIEQLKALGLSLEEIGSVVELYFMDPSGRMAKLEVLAILRGHLAEAERKISGLDRFRADLQAHIVRFERWLEHHDGSIEEEDHG